MNESRNMNSSRPASDVLAAPVEMQLTKLSSVLNGLDQGASAMRRHVTQAMAALKSGTYKVNASAVSRLIISESLGCNSQSAEQP